MQSRTVARELALLMLGQISDRPTGAGAAPAADMALDTLLHQALATLSNHVREALDQAWGLWLDRMEHVEGMLAARNLPAGSRITLGDIAPPAIVRKGDVVTVVLTKGRVKVTARAIANQDAPLGGRVLLTNPSTRSTLTGVVQAPGLVVVPQ